MIRKCLLALVAVGLWFGLSGCSATSQASNAAQATLQLLDGASARLNEIIDETAKETPDPKVIRDLAEDAQSNVTVAREKVNHILDQIPRMEDKVPLWLRLLYLFVVVSGLALVWILLERTGAIQVIRGFFWNLGMLIPKAATKEAKILEDLEEGRKDPKEVTQYFRTAYPDINAAIDKRKRTGKTQHGTGSQSSSSP
jgi:hypothetical protein